MPIGHLASVIVRYFDIVRITINEAETDAPLVVDGNRVLSSSVSAELVKPIPRRNAQIIEARGQVDVLQFSSRTPCYVGRQPPRTAPREQPLRLLVREGSDHTSTVPRHVTHVIPEVVFTTEPWGRRTSAVPSHNGFALQLRAA